jgi:hypothetical protein
MDQFSPFTFKDLCYSVAFGVLVGWLLISIHDPAHKRFQFDLAAALWTERTKIL